MTRLERGSVTVHATVVLTVLVLLSVVALQAATLVRLRHQAQSAADLAALGASQASVAGQDGCEAAGDIAQRNGAELAECRMDHDVATVTVRSARASWWARTWSPQATARAAPVSYLQDGS